MAVKFVRFTLLVADGKVNSSHNMLTFDNGDGSAIYQSVIISGAWMDDDDEKSLSVFLIIHPSSADMAFFFLLPELSRLLCHLVASLVVASNENTH